MATLPEAVRAHLLADATIVGLVVDRVYPIIMPQNPTLPALRYSITSGESMYSTDGPSDLANINIQIDCFAETYPSADALFEAVRKKMNLFSGNVLGLDVLGIFLVRQGDLYDNETETFRRIAEFSIWSEEAN